MSVIFIKGVGKAVPIRVLNLKSLLLQMLNEKDFVSKKIGIRIFKGSGSTDNNLNVSLRNEIRFENIERIGNDEQLKQHLKELREINEKIYAWAALTRVQKEAYSGMKILFIIDNTNELFVFDYINSFHDEESEFQKYITWKGHGFEEIVFLKNKQEMQLSDEQKKSILDLLGARYVPAGESNRYASYPEVIFGEDIKKLSDIILRKTAH